MEWIREEVAEKKVCPFKDTQCITCGCMAWEYENDDVRGEAIGRCRMIP